MDPVHDLRSMWALRATFRSLDLDACLVYAGKAVIYGSMAARLAGIPSRAAMITGAGSGLVGGAGWKRRALASLLRTLYAVALRQTQIVFFQNPDDERLFVQARMVSRGQRRVRINGSGVDLTEFAATPLPEGPTTFLLIARLIREKGIVEYVDAARRLRSRGVDARFQILGSLDTNPTAITQAEVTAWQESGVVEYLGETDDVRPFIGGAHVCVLPSYYGEGVPRSLLEGLAMGRPIVTTDMPGCRETVVDGHNGYVVPARDPVALADAMMRLIDHPDQIVRMGTASRELAAERFDVRKVNQVILEAMGLRTGPASSA
jgi:glycosyltransferase involved in cell wall biosynthesis